MVDEPAASNVHYHLLHHTVHGTIAVCWFHIYQVKADKSLVFESPTYINFRISNYLKIESTLNNSRQRRERNAARRKKTNKILVSVSLVFFISWAPLNILTLALDFYQPFEVKSTSSKDEEHYTYIHKKEQHVTLTCGIAEHLRNTYSCCRINPEEIMNKYFYSLPCVTCCP